jgi:hypothetical protein
VQNVLSERLSTEFLTRRPEWVQELQQLAQSSNADVALEVVAPTGVTVTVTGTDTVVTGHRHGVTAARDTSASSGSGGGGGNRGGGGGGNGGGANSSLGARHDAAAKLAAQTAALRDALLALDVDADTARRAAWAVMRMAGMSTATERERLAVALDWIATEPAEDQRRAQAAADREAEAGAAAGVAAAAEESRVVDLSQQGQSSARSVAQMEEGEGLAARANGGGFVTTSASIRLLFSNLQEFKRGITQDIANTSMTRNTFTILLSRKVPPELCWVIFSYLSSVSEIKRALLDPQCSLGDIGLQSVTGSTGAFPLYPVPSLARKPYTGKTAEIWQYVLSYLNNRKPLVAAATTTTDMFATEGKESCR